MAELAVCRGTGGPRDALLVRIMSDCLLRGAEAGGARRPDVAFEDGWLCVELWRSKTDQEGRGVVLYACAATARLARRWLKMAEVSDGTLFRPVNKAGRVADTRLTVLQRVQRRQAVRCGAEVGGRVSWSLRVGAVAAGRWTQVGTGGALHAGSAVCEISYTLHAKRVCRRSPPATP